MDNSTVSEHSAPTSVIWNISMFGWLLGGAIALLLGTMFFAGLDYMVGQWSREEYSHGYLLPVVAVFLIWQKRTALEKTPFTGSWAGLAIVGFGVVLMVAGKLSTLYTISQYAFLVVLGGLLLAFMGWRGFKIIL